MTRGRRKTGTPPPLLEHKAKGVAYVNYQGKITHLGPWDPATGPSAQSRRNYADWIARWEKANLPREVKPSGPHVTVADLVRAFHSHAKQYYRRPDGKPTSEVRGFRLSLDPLVKLHAARPVDEIRARDVKAILDAWVRKGHTRPTINQMLGRIKRCFEWGAAEELVDEDTAARVKLVKGLRAGRTDAPENEEVLPVPEADLAKVLGWLDARPLPKKEGASDRARQLAAMVRLQNLCGCRPEEACSIRAGEVLKGELRLGKRVVPLPEGVWVYFPQWSKTVWRGKKVFYTLGPQAQAVLTPWLEGKAEEEHLFCANRSPCWHPSSYAHAIARACERAGVTPWSPGRLRHNFLTRADRASNLVLASASVRHSSLETTLIYIERDLPAVAELAKRIG